MPISSYTPLLRRLRAWRFSPSAALLYLDLHDLRGLNALDPVAADWAGGGGIGLRLWSNEYVVARDNHHPQSAVEEARALRERLLSLAVPGLPPAWTLSLSIGVAVVRPDADWETA